MGATFHQLWPAPDLDTWRDGVMRLRRRRERWLTSGDAWRFLAMIVAGFLVAFSGTVLLATLWEITR